MDRRHLSRSPCVAPLSLSPSPSPSPSLPSLVASHRQPTGRPAFKNMDRSMDRTEHGSKSWIDVTSIHAQEHGTWIEVTDPSTTSIALLLSERRRCKILNQRKRSQDSMLGNRLAGRGGSPAGHSPAARPSFYFLSCSRARRCARPQPDHTLLVI
jgi:hypothetical protein